MFSAAIRREGFARANALPANFSLTLYISSQLSIVHIAPCKSRPAMRLRALRSFLLAILFAIALAPPPAFAQSPSDAELNAMGSRVTELYQAGKYGEAIPVQERYAAATAARYGEDAPEYATALNNLAQLLQATNRLSEAEPLIRRALAIDRENASAPSPSQCGQQT